LAFFPFQLDRPPYVQQKPLLQCLSCQLLDADNDLSSTQAEERMLGQGWTCSAKEPFSVGDVGCLFRRRKGARRSVSGKPGTTFWRLYLSIGHGDGSVWLRDEPNSSEGLHALVESYNYVPRPVAHLRVGRAEASLHLRKPSCSRATSPSQRAASRSSPRADTDTD
jgi:hypothetical protein